MTRSAVNGWVGQLLYAHMYNCERSELSNPGSILMMCVRMYVRTYVSVMLRNVAVTSRRNVASMMRIRRASYTSEF